MSLKTWTVVAGAALAFACAVIACSDDATPAPSGTSSSSGSTSSSSGSTSSSSGSTSSSSGSTSSSSGSTSSSSGSTPDAGDTLYTRLGGKAGIATAIDAIVTAELANPEISTYFAVVGPGGTGPTSPDQIKECLVNQLGTAAGGPSTEVSYPTVVSGGFTCRSMAKAHAELGIPNGVFDNFVAIAAGVLKGAGVVDADITLIGSVLNGTKADVVTDMSRDGGVFDLDASGNN